ncbi:MAG: type II secretion system F family protein, partial [Deltaproteobacteria bacterium]|nr:type II secretion system F family protein [Deltaproteobacteria bacterium]
MGLGGIIILILASIASSVVAYFVYAGFDERRGDFIKIFAPEEKEGKRGLSSFLEKYRIYILFLLIAASTFFIRAGIFIIIAAAVVFLIKKQRDARLKKEIVKNFPNALSIMKMAAKAGLPLHGAVKNVMEYSASPQIREVFKKIYHVSYTLGEPVEKTIFKEGKRLDLPDLIFLASVIEAHVEVGGNIVELLDLLEENMRRLSVAGDRVSSLMTEGRISVL